MLMLFSYLEMIIVKYKLLKAFSMIIFILKIWGHLDFFSDWDCLISKRHHDQLEEIYSAIIGWNKTTGNQTYTSLELNCTNSPMFEDGYQYRTLH